MLYHDNNKTNAYGTIYCIIIIIRWETVYLYNNYGSLHTSSYGRQWFVVVAKTSLLRSVTGLPYGRRGVCARGLRITGARRVFRKNKNIVCRPLLRQQVRTL